MAIQDKRIVIIGFGSIGRGIIPLLKRHFAGWQITIVEQTFDESQRRIAAQYGLQTLEATIRPGNYVEVLSPLLGDGTFLLNLATSISSKALIELAQSRGALYVDSCIDPWEYHQTAHGIDTSNYALREDIRAFRIGREGLPTAIVAHGANPGFVSILVKRGLLQMAQEFGLSSGVPASRQEWARLARDLDLRVIQISERDTQVRSLPRHAGEFVCTWSVDGFITESLQPAEIGWGTHETELPRDAITYDTGCQAAIAIDRPSCTIKVRSWSPNNLDFEGFLITHNEAISLADYFTYREGDTVAYRPTSYYAYHPCDEAVESLTLLQDGTPAAVTSKRILGHEILSGIDELGVFLISGSHPSLWLGSNLSIGKARKMAAHNNATSLQVVASIVAGMAWALENPRRGVLESEELDHAFIYDFAQEYWAPIVCQYRHWRPRAGADQLLFGDFLVQP